MTNANIVMTIAAVASCVPFLVVYRIFSADRAERKASFAFGASAAVWLVAFSILFADDYGAMLLNLMMVLSGAAAGLVIGALVTPRGTEEKDRFSELTRTVGTLGAGFVAGKADTLVTHVLDPSFFFDPIHGFRMMAFLIATAIAGVATYAARAYD